MRHTDRWSTSPRPEPFHVLDAQGREVPGEPPKTMAAAVKRLAFWNEFGLQGPYSLARPQAPARPEWKAAS